MSRKTNALIGAVAAVGLAVGLCACGTHTPVIREAAQPVVVVTHTVTAQAPAPKTITKGSVPVTPAAVPSAAPVQANATAVVSQYYQDITDGNYPAAWSLGGNNIGGTNYTAWVAGYLTTQSISLGTVSSFSENQVTAVLYATQDSGSVNTYEGTYTISNGVIVSANITQTS
jgi:hypothetical protein